MKTTRNLIQICRLGATLLLALPVVVQAQFTFITNNGAITITGYTGSGGNVDIPSTTNGYPVTSIGANAFYNKTAVTGVIIPNSVTNIGNGAFRYSYGLTNIAVNAANPIYASASGVLFNKAMTTLVEFPGGLVGSYEVPNSVTSIGIDAFIGCSSLKNVALPNSVTSIGNSSFQYCSGLTNVAIGNNVANIGFFAFEYCSGLKNVTIPDNVAYIGGAAFRYCYGLTNIAVNAANPSYASASGVLFNKTMDTLIQCPGGLAGSYALPNSVTRIEAYAFASCSGLTSVMIGNNVTSINIDAFLSCSGLTSVAIPNSVSYIDNEAFEDCENLASVTIGDSVTTIGSFVFWHCSGLTNVTIPNSVTSIGVYAFANCSGLHQAYFQGNAPSVNGGPGSADSTLFYGESGTVYYLPGTSGWGATFGGWSTAVWRPQMQLVNNSKPSTNGFGFNINWASGQTVLVEASTNLQNWTPVITNALVNGTNAFRDTTWTNYPQRFYRIRSP